MKKIVMIIALCISASAQTSAPTLTADSQRLFKIAWAQVDKAHADVVIAQQREDAARNLAYSLAQQFITDQKIDGEKYEGYVEGGELKFRLKENPNAKTSPAANNPSKP